MNSERDAAIQYLEQTRARLLSFAASLPIEHRDYRRTESDWSAAELIEHIVVVEAWALGQASNGVPDESRRGKGTHKDLLIESVPARARKAQAPEAFCPANRWPDWDTMLQEFTAIRNRAIRFARTTGTDMRIYFAPHPFFKDLDQYQWLMLIAAHSERHIRQAEEMLALRAAAQ